MLWCPIDHSDLDYCPAVVLRWRRASEVTDVLTQQPEPEAMQFEYLPEHRTRLRPVDLHLPGLIRPPAPDEHAVTVRPPLMPRRAQLFETCWERDRGVTINIAPCRVRDRDQPANPPTP
ncbi:MAG: hypothetical protein JWL58_3643 [Streptosporangiaceae bacterium]|nr:hypothetical protein [Streptosporangiaceae bacterium]